MDMARIRYFPEQIIAMLRDSEALLNQATPLAEVCRKQSILAEYGEDS